MVRFVKKKKKPVVGADPVEYAVERVRREYAAEVGVALYRCDGAGVTVSGKLPCRDGNCDECAGARRLAIEESIRWGEATVMFCPRKRLVWAVPLMTNQELLGGLVAYASEQKAFGAGAARGIDIRRACIRLREMAEAANLTNAALLRENRGKYLSEQRRAYALHFSKEIARRDIRELYIREEPSLMSAIRAGDRKGARETINRILLAVHNHAGDRIDLIKSYHSELIASMSRAAVEAGGNPRETLAANLAAMKGLAGIDDHAELAAWLRETLESMMQRIERGKNDDLAVLLSDAIGYMQRHLAEKISRDDAAKAAHLSPSYFSAMLRKHTGTTFTDLLTRIRVDRAAELMATTDRPLGLIALDAGFGDQSYFTKVFKQYRREAPLDYRRRIRKDAAD